MSRNQRKSAQAATTLGETAAKVVTEARDGAKALRHLTVWLVVLTIVNTAFVIYSVAK
jgi:preprotein translocase subunit SecG